MTPLDSKDAELTMLRAELAILRARLEQLEASQSHHSVPATLEEPRPTTRRRLLQKLGIVTAGGLITLGINGSSQNVDAQTVSGNTVTFNGGDTNYGGKFAGGLAPIYLKPSSNQVSGPPSSGAHLVGELYVDKAGSLFYCVSSGTPGGWRKLAGVETAGAYHSLPTPVRIVQTDYNPPIGICLNPPNTKLSGFGTVANVDAVKKTYAVTLATPGANFGIPTGATAIVGNIVGYRAALRGYVTLWTYGTPYPLVDANTGISSLELIPEPAMPPPYPAIMNSFTLELSNDGKFNIAASVACDIVIQVIGYYK